MSRAGARPTECEHAEVDLHGHKCTACGLRSHRDTTTGRFTSVKRVAADIRAGVQNGWEMLAEPQLAWYVAGVVVGAILW